MAPRIQFNVRVSGDTPGMVDRLCRLTSRHPGDLIDWLVKKAYDELVMRGNGHEASEELQPAAVNGDE